MFYNFFQTCKAKGLNITSGNGFRDREGQPCVVQTNEREGPENRQQAENLPCQR